MTASCRVTLEVSGEIEGENQLFWLLSETEGEDRCPGSKVTDWFEGGANPTVCKLR